MSWWDVALVFLIIIFGILLVWSKVQQQRMIDTLYEIKEFIQSIKEK